MGNCKVQQRHFFKLQQKLFELHFKYPNGHFAIIKTYCISQRKSVKSVVVCILNTGS